MAPNPHVMAGVLAARIAAHFCLFVACIYAIGLGGKTGGLVLACLHFVYFMMIVGLQLVQGLSHENDVSRWSYVLGNQIAISRFIERLASGEKPRDIDWRAGSQAAIDDITSASETEYPNRSLWWTAAKVAGYIALFAAGAATRIVLAGFFV